MSETTRARAKVAALTRSRGAEDAELQNAQRDLAEANIKAAIAKNVAAAPPLTPEQKARITRALWGAPTERGLYSAVSALADEALTRGGAR